MTKTATNSFDGLIKLCVTAIKLRRAPAFADERHLIRNVLVDYWGNNPDSCFAVDPWYLSSVQLNEECDAIAALHATEVQVLLDIVYIYTAEDDELGPTMSFPSIENASYCRVAEDRRYHVNNPRYGKSRNIAYRQMKRSR